MLSEGKRTEWKKEKGARAIPPTRRPMIPDFVDSMRWRNENLSSLVGGGAPSFLERRAVGKASTVAKGGCLNPWRRCSEFGVAEENATAKGMADGRIVCDSGRRHGSATEAIIRAGVRDIASLVESGLVF